MRHLCIIIGLQIFFQTLTLDDPVCHELSCKHPDSACYCDDLCLLIGDCCSDSLAHSNRSIFEAKDDIGQSFLNSYEPFLQCVALAKKNYMIINKCMEDNNNMDIRQNCEELSQSDLRNIAVSLSNMYINGFPIVFRNMYCALCHGVSLNITLPWTGKLACEAEIMEDDTTDEIQRKCSLVHQSFPSDVTRPRECLPQEFRTCPKEVESYTKGKCNLYIDPVIVTDVSLKEGEIFKNKYCLSCNDIKTNESLICGKVNNTNDFDGKHDLHDRNHSYWISLKDSSYVVSSNTSGSMFVVPFCTDGRLFSIISENHVKKECVREHRDDKCMPLLTPMVFKPTQGNESTDIMLVSPVIVFSELQNECSLNDSNFTQLKSYGKRWSAFTGMDEASLLGSLLECLDSVMTSKHKMLAFQNFMNKSALRCNDGILAEEYVNITFFTQRPEDIMKYRLCIFNTSSELLNLRFNLHLVNNTTIIHTIWYCIIATMPYPNCKTITSYGVEEFVIRNGTAKHKNSEISFPKGTYSLRGKTLIVCSQTYDIDLEKATDKDFYSFLYASCFCVSFVSFLVIVFIHLYFPKLRNLHGKCIISHSSALTLTQAVILIGYFIPQKYSRVCAIILHFSFYAIFSWVVVLGFNFARRLNSKSLGRVPNGNESSLFLRYSIFGWTLPVIAIIIFVFADALRSWKFIGYGNGEEVCRLGSFKATFYSFIIPGTTFLIINFIFLIIVICGIESSKSQSKILGKSGRHNGRCAMYTKISMFMGVTWIIIALSEIYSNGEDALYVLNIIINGSQCFFLLLAILCNRKMKQNLRKMTAPSSTREQTRL